MDHEELKRFASALPKDFRLRWRSADLEGPAELVFDKPDHHLIERASKKGFLGLFRGWQAIGYIFEYWPAYADDIIFLRHGCYSPYFTLITEVLRSAKLDRKVWAVPVELKSVGLKYNLDHYADLKGLYIPEQGEIIHWGTGHAIVTLSPLTDNPTGFRWWIRVISINAIVAGHEDAFKPFTVYNNLAMGPYEPIPVASQAEVIEYYNTNFNGRFTWLFQKRPEVKEMWEEYKKNKGL